MKIPSVTSIMAILLFLTVGMTRCTKSDITSDDDVYFIFGTAYCECLGQCATLYKVSGESLYSAEGTGCAPSAYHYTGTPLSEDNFQIAVQLVNEFPEFLNTSTADTYGCPDCADQGGYYLELKTTNSHRIWRIDTRADAIPVSLRPYQSRIADVMIALQ